MPLSEQQKEFIISSLDSFLDFPTKSVDLIESTKKLYNELHSSLVEKTSPNYWIQKCLHHPDLHLRGLEKQQSEPITVSEVQHYILDLISDRLMKASCDAKVPFEQLLWDTNEILKILPTREANKLFKSVAARIESGPGPEELPELPNSIYTQTLRIEEKIEVIPIDEEENFDGQEELINTSLVAYVDLVITCAKTTFKKSVHVCQLDYFESDEEQDLFMETVVSPEAQKIALKVAAAYALNYFEYEDPEYDYDNDDFADEELTEEEQLIYTNRYYFNKLLTSEIYFRDVANLKGEEVENLLNISCINLIESKISSLEEIKGLTNSEKIMVSHPIYFSLLQKQKIDMADIIGIRERRRKFLIQPPIAHLIQLGILDLSVAKKLPLIIQDILTSSLYTNYFLTHSIPWDNFDYFLPKHRKLFLNPLFASLIINDIVKIENVIYFPVQIIDFLNDAKHICILKWLEKRIIDIDLVLECNENKSYYCYARAFAKRLFALQQKSPFVINNVTDTLEIVILEIEEATQFFDAVNSFYKLVIQSFMLYLKFDLEENLKKHQDDSFFDPIYQKFIDVLNETDQSVRDWENKFRIITQMATDIDQLINQEQISSPPRKIARTNVPITFFNLSRKSDHSHSYLTGFCHSLEALAKDLPLPAERAPEKKFYRMKF